MALIEHLQNDEWQPFFRNCFVYTLNILKNDPHARVGSSVDDLRSWFRTGGLPNVQERLNAQMEVLRFSDNQKKAIQDYLSQLAQEHRGVLLELTTKGILPDSLEKGFIQETLTHINLTELIEKITSGERPFEDWMYAHGRTKEEIEKIYLVIDKWLMQHGIIPNKLN